MPQVGDVLAGKYRLDARLGAGGMGVVYAATHVALAQRVAVKLLRSDAGDETSTAAARLLREARALATLRSDHVARVHDVGVLDDGAPYLVMELLAGTTLDRFVVSRGRLTVAEAAEIAIQACHGLGEAHAHGIVHRDVKASNLFLAFDAAGTPRVKVIDFGISRTRLPAGEAAAETKSGALLGSPPYMSPEQIHAAKNVDARTDIWSLGVVLYFMVAGHLPFKGESLLDLMTLIAFEDPPPVGAGRDDLPAAFADVVARCMRKERADRFPSAAALAAALVPFAPPRAEAVARSVPGDENGASVLDDATGGAAAATPGEEVVTVAELAAPASPRPRARRSVGVAAAAAAGAVALVLGGLHVAGRARTPATPDPAAATSRQAAPPTATAATTAMAAASAAAAPAPSATPTAPPSSAPSATGPARASTPAWSAPAPARRATSRTGTSSGARRPAPASSTGPALPTTPD